MSENKDIKDIIEEKPKINVIEPLKSSFEKDRDEISSGDIEAGKGNIASKGLKTMIVKTILQPSYVRDVKDTIDWRFKWRKISDVLFTIAKVVGLSSAVVAFAASSYDDRSISFIAGCVSLSGTMLIQLADFAKNKSRQKTAEANEILGKLGIEGVPDILDSDIGSRDKEKK
jgi:hypothetical protein